MITGAPQFSVDRSSIASNNWTSLQACRSTTYLSICAKMLRRSSTTSSKRIYLVASYCSSTLEQPAKGPLRPISSTIATPRARLPLDLLNSVSSLTMLGRIALQRQCKCGRRCYARSEISTGSGFLLYPRFWCARAFRSGMGDGSAYYFGAVEESDGPLNDGLENFP